MDHDNVIAQALAELRVAPRLPDPLSTTPPPERFTRRGLSLRSAPPDSDGDGIDLDALGDVLMQVTADYLATATPREMLLIAAPAGSGKTRHAVRMAEQQAAAGCHVLYAGPRRDFYADVQAEAQRPAWWYAWQPRHQGNLEAIPILRPTCRWSPQIEAWMQRGYAAMDFCSNPRICGWDYVTTRCPYHAQRQRTEPLIFGQHAHVALGHPLMDRFQLVIGDELPLAAFLHPWRIPLSAIVPPNMDDLTVETLLRNLRWLAVNPPDDATGWEGAALYQALPGGAAAVLDTFQRYAATLETLAYAPELRTAAAAEDAPFFHLLSLATLMLREAARVADGLDVIPRVRLDAEGLLLRLRHSPAALPAHVVWLDATGDAGIYEALFQRPVRIVRPKVRLRGRIFQLWPSANNRGALLDDTPSQDGQTAGQHKLSDIKAQIDRILSQHSYQAPALISYKPLADALLPGATYSHFGAARGTNRLQGCDALFVIGAPMPPMQAITEMASMVYFDRDAPFVAEWHAIDVPFTGQAAAYTVGGFWDDADLTTLLRQIRESELVQAVHRARPLRRDVDVWLLTNVVTDLPVTLISLHELFDALDASGRPITGIDVLRWPELLALASSAAAPLTARRIEDELHVSKRTAQRWYAALLTTGIYTEIDIPTSGQRGRPSRGVVKSFVR